MTNRALVQWFCPGALAVLVMLPRLASPRFGLLDDGLTLQTGREVIGRWSSVLDLIPETGRFFPAYWLVYSAIFGIVGVHPLPFFAINVVLLAALLALLARFVRVSGGTPPQAVVALVLLALSGPVVEAFYTLSKAEPLQMTWIAASVLATAASVSASPAGRRGALVTLATLASLLACATKETSLVLVPVSLGWLLIEWRSVRTREPWARFARTYVVVNLVAAAAFALLRWRYAALPLGEGTYTRAYALQPAAIRIALLRVAAWMLRDFAFLLPLLAAALVLALGRRPEARRPILYACVWMAGWLVVYVPWAATFEYYLLPFAFGAAALAATAVVLLWRLRGHAYAAATRWVAWSALVASALLWLSTVVNATTDGRVQIAVDRANADLVDFLAGVPDGSRIVLNTTYPNEYLHELSLHLSEIKRRPDIVVQHVGAPAALRRSAGDVFVATASLANRPALTVRIALDEAGVRADNLRLGALLDARGELVYASERQVRVVEAGIQRLLCHATSPLRIDPAYCPGDRGVFHARTFGYGWRVHRLARPAADRPGTRT
jgi:hypothetical protein